MAVGGMSVALLLLIFYFVKRTGADQNLDLDYSVEFHPKRTTVSTTMDIEAPPRVVWNMLTDMSNYKLWLPWIHRIHVNNNDVDRWVHKHSLLKYNMEVGSRFQIQPFFGAPYNGCRFISIDPEKVLMIEMCFFPLNREVVTFTLTPYKNCVEVTYTSTNSSLLNFITASMFAWQGKDVLKNLREALPEIELDEEVSEAVAAAPQFVIDDNFINALVAKAYAEGPDILNGISDKVVRGKAKSGLVKAKRSGTPPEATPETQAAVNQFLSGGIAPSAVSAPAVPAVDVPENVLINQYVLKGLDGDMDIINAIDDRVFRSKVKSSLTKAKRTGERPEIPPDTPPLGGESVPVEPAAATTPPQATDEDTLINTYVANAMKGDEEAIAAIEDRILRAKVKSMLFKAKKRGGVPKVPDSTPQAEASVAKSAEAPADDSPDAIIDQSVQAALNGNMDLINGINDRVLRSKAKSALVKAKRSQN
tara:strand:+ start:24867 stop:26297 length:1431 start_codon:yes stop_codon:yes gene_type:complete